MSNQTAEFTIKLKDETSGAAQSAAGALKQLRDQIDGDTRALAEMQKAMRNLQGGTSVNVDAYRKLSAAIAEKKSSIGQAQASFLALGGTFSKSAPAARSFRDRMAELTKQTSVMPGPMGQLVSRLGGIRGLVVAGGIAAGIATITAALAALTAATVAAVGALTRYGIAQADARRSEHLRLQGLTKLRFWYQYVRGNADEMQDSLDRVAASTAIGRDKLVGYQEQLYKMGLRGKNLDSALEGMAIKASVQGEQYANMFAGWAAGLNLTGGSVQKFSDNVKARLGGIAAKQMESLTVQAVKQREAFDALFAKLKIDAFLKGLKSIRDLLGQGTASGRALRQMLTLALQPLIGGATEATPLFRRFFQGLILGAQNITIAVLRVRVWLKKTFGDTELFAWFDKKKAALNAGKVALGLFAGALFTVAAGVTAVATAFTVLLGAPIVIVAAMYMLGRKIGDFFASIDWAGYGRTIWQGIVTGITAGVKWVAEAASKLAAEAARAFRQKLGISSPSKAFMRFGLALPEGVAAGVQTGAPAAQREVAGMIEPPTTARSVPAAAASAPRIPIAPATAVAPTTPRGSTSVPVTIGDIHIHVSGGKDLKAKELAADLRREIESIFEGVAIQLGASLPGGGAA